MQLILHIGTSKTGTTSIQNFLAENYHQLKSRGILYPVRGTITAHHMLMPAAFSDIKGRHLPQQFFFNSNVNRFERYFKSFWGKVESEIETGKYHTVVISAETLFRDFSTVSTEPLSQFLGRYFDSVKVVAYVRSPVADYVSRVSQHIRLAKTILEPHARRLKSVLEYYEGQFPGCVYVQPFDRKKLHDGDIIKDFICKYLPQLSDLSVEGGSYNRSLPAELLQTIEQYRLQLQPSGRLPNWRTRAMIMYCTDHYKSRLKEPDKNEKPVLRPEIKQYIEKTAVDYLWLRSRYGVSFDDLDYGTIEIDALERIEEPQCQCLNEIFQFDRRSENWLVEMPSSPFITWAIAVKYFLKRQASMTYRAKVRYR